MFNAHLQRKYKIIEEHEVRYEAINIHEADIILVAYGTSARICKEVVKKSQRFKFRVGMVRPITLWPFPKEIIRKNIRKGAMYSNCRDEHRANG